MAETPAARLLALLELLQSRPSASGAELAEALGVTDRSLRRYVQRLVDLGIPVESERGPYGGYRLRPGYRLPPLMLTADEAVAVTLGLALTRARGVGAAPAATSALAKVQRVLPAEVSERVRALGDALGVVVPASTATEADPRQLAELGAAAGRGRTVRFLHRPPSGEPLPRTVDPYGVVFHAGRWYVVGRDHDRAALRTFRIDRIEDVVPTGGRFRQPDGFDAVGHLVASLATVPYPVSVEVVLHTDLLTARRLVPATVGVLEPHAEGVLARIGAVSAESAARHLAMLDVGFHVLAPDEVRAALRALGAALAAAAGP
jgi:predicted DNA-binding transcriptional regulator YafY